VAVALAHRLARLIWILLTRQEHYNATPTGVSAKYETVYVIPVLLNSVVDKGIKPVWVLWKARHGITPFYQPA
jgi:hypothetical protein